MQLFEGANYFPAIHKYLSKTLSACLIRGFLKINTSGHFEVQVGSSGQNLQQIQVQSLFVINLLDFLGLWFQFYAAKYICFKN